jgi:hypothetical protein
VYECRFWGLDNHPKVFYRVHISEVRCINRVGPGPGRAVPASGSIDLWGGKDVQPPSGGQPVFPSGFLAVEDQRSQSTPGIRLTGLPGRTEEGYASFLMG